MYDKLLEQTEKVNIDESENPAKLHKLRMERKKAERELKKYKAANDKEMIDRFEEEIEEIDARIEKLK